MIRALSLIVFGPALATAAFVGAIVDVVRLARREARLQRIAQAAAEQHRADVRAELTSQRRRVAGEREWGSN
ncbi:MAG TPA: hypothetical protein VK540_30490 [Polyangiaceae bacterium]|nr:hypothetical protein [Polyangiaceae bacterium]